MTFFFFFQAEDGIRDVAVTGVQTCALPILNDIEKSLAWYRDVLGCLEKERWERDGKLAGAEMRAGAVAFYIEQDDWKKGRDRGKGEGFSIYCTTAQDVDALAATIKARGGTLAEEPQSRPRGSPGLAHRGAQCFK